MKSRYCPECGHENPGQARFCMDCGHSLSGYAVAAEGASPQRRGETDWAAMAATALATLGLAHLSRKTRTFGCLALFFLLFFGGPMVCGLIMFMAESVSNLFR